MNKPMIYLDNAATTLKKPPQVTEAVCQAMSTMGNAGRGAHESTLSSSMLIYETRKKLAAFFHCSRADHVVFTSNVTEALNIALFGLLKEGDHVITTKLEHNSVLRPLYELEAHRGVTIDYVRTDFRGNADLSDLESLIRENTKLIVCTHASNLTGNVVDIKKAGEIAHKHHILLVVDAAQTAGVFDIDMMDMNIDVLCVTGHKGMMGPQGTGAMLIREGVEIVPLKYGGTGVQSYLRGQPENYPARLEAGTLNAHGIAGLSAAIDFICETGIRQIREHERMLTERFLGGIEDMEQITIYGDFRAEHAGIVSLNIHGYDSAIVSDILAQEYQIATRPGAHCAPRMHEALGTVETGAVRFSFGYFNTVAEIDAAIHALREICEDTCNLL